VSCNGQVVEKLEQNGEHCVQVEFLAANQYGRQCRTGELLFG
jgi:hypothetical protein